MIQKLIAMAVIVGAAYWWWQGPYRDRVDPSYELILQSNDENMAMCQRAEAYQLGATGSGLGEEPARRKCAEEYNVYYEDGHWHSYEMTRPE